MESTKYKKDDIRLDTKDLILKDNKVSSTILPETSSQLNRNILIEGNVEILGSVYGTRIIIHAGSVIFRKAVFAKDELIIDSTVSEDIIFHEAVGSSSVVSVTPFTAHVLFGADINAKRLNLRNSFIGGSLYADEIQLENCVVIGGVFASKKLQMTHSIVGTFNSQEVIIEKSCYLLYPSAFSVEPIKPTMNAELNNISLVDLMSLFKGDEPKPGTGMIPINITADAQRTNLKAEDGTILLVHSYSVAGKVLVADMVYFEQLNNHFLINAGALSSQMLKEYKVENELGQSRSLTLDEIAEFFFRILDKKVKLTYLDSTIDINQLIR